MAMPNMKLIGEFVTQLEMPQAFLSFLYKMAARGHFVFPIDDKNHRVLVVLPRLHVYTPSSRLTEIHVF